ncbi:MAG: methyltransferase domain-containing protein, partial [Pseudomonadota bacterium]
MSMMETDYSAGPADTAAPICPACGHGPMRVFYNVAGAPTNSCILLPTEQEALGYPRGDVKLGFCPSCGFIYNTAFDLRNTEYSGRYEETQAYSGVFNAFHDALARRLIDRYNLRGKTVLEIGCGKGEFLSLLAELGDNRGIGIDPGIDVDRIPASVAANLEFIPDFYSEKYGSHEVDFLACKMTLEHIPTAGEFVATVRRGLGARHDAVVFFQIPEATRII